MTLKTLISILRVFSIDKLCGEIYVTKYMYADSEEHLNLFKYDCFLYVIILHCKRSKMPSKHLPSFALLGDFFPFDCN